MIVNSKPPFLPLLCKKRKEKVFRGPGTLPRQGWLKATPKKENKGLGQSSIRPNHIWQRVAEIPRADR